MKVKKTTKTTIKKKNKKGSKKSEEPIVKVLNLNVNASGHVKMTRRDDGKTEVS